LTWYRLNLYVGHYSISIAKLRRGQNDATRARPAAGRAVARQAAGVRAGTEWERFYYFLLMRRDPISAEALQLHWHLFTSWLLAYPRTPIYCPVWLPFGLHTEIPVPWLARIGPWESRSLRDVRRSWSSSARVKTIGDQRFWGVSSTRLLAVCVWSVAADGIASSGTTTLTSAMSTSTGLNAAGYILQFLIVLYIIYIFTYYAISNLVMNFASGMFLISIS
jgi:hypothetical protein